MSIRVMLVLDLQEPNDRDALERVPYFLGLLAGHFSRDADRMGKFSLDAQNKMLVAVGFRIAEPDAAEGRVIADLLAYAKHIEPEQFGVMPTME